MKIFKNVSVGMLFIYVFLMHGASMIDLLNRRAEDVKHFVQRGITIRIEPGDIVAQPLNKENQNEQK